MPRFFADTTRALSWRCRKYANSVAWRARHGCASCTRYLPPGDAALLRDGLDLPVSPGVAGDRTNCHRVAWDDHQCIGLFIRNEYIQMAPNDPNAVHATEITNTVNFILTIPQKKSSLVRVSVKSYL